MYRVDLGGGVSRIALASLALAIPAATANAVSYWEDDYDLLNGLGWANPPADLIRPDVQPILNSAGVSNVIISPNWIITAAHTADQNNDLVADPGWRVGTTLLRYDGVEYRRATDAIIHPTLDVAVVKLEERDTGNPANFGASSIAVLPDADDSLVGESIVITGNGASGRYAADGTITGTNSRPLRWGNNVLTQDTGTNIIFSFDAPSSNGYIDYEALGRQGDSGGAHLARVDLGWSLAGVTGVPLSSTKITPQLRDWIENAIDEPLPDPHSGRHQATTATTSSGVANRSWASPSTWTAAMPGTSDTAWVNGSTYYSVVSSGYSAASRLFVGVHDTNVTNSSQSGSLRIDGGTMEVAESIVFGAEAGDSGSGYQSGGALSSIEMVIGYRGHGAYYADNGTIETKVLRVGTHSPGQGTNAYGEIGGRFDLGGSASIDTDGLIIAAKQDSQGRFNMLADPWHSLSSGVTAVGVAGDGAFLQQGGTHNTGTLSLGEVSSTMGYTYSLEGGRLNADVVSIDVAGSLSQTGGEVRINEGLHGDGSYELLGGKLTIGHGTRYRGNIAFPAAGPGGELTFEGHVSGAGALEMRDLSSLKFTNPHNAVLSSDAGGFYLVRDATTATAFNAAAVGPTHARGGGDLLIGSNDVFIRGQDVVNAVPITDRVVLTTGGRLTVGNPVFADGSESVYLNGGIDVSGGTLLVSSGYELRAAVSSSFTEVTVSGQGIVVAQQGSTISLDNADTTSFAESSELIAEAGSTLAFGSTSFRDGSKLTAAAGSTVSFSQLTIETGEVTINSAPAVSIEAIGAVAIEHDATLKVGYDSQGNLPRIVGYNASISGSLAFDIDDRSSLTLGSESVLIGGTNPVVPGTLTGSFVAVSGATGDHYELAVVYSSDTLAGVSFDSTEYVKVVVALPGDVNLDGAVGPADLAIVGANWDPTGSNSGNRWALGDLNQDGAVGPADQAILGANWNPTGQSVPEPTTATAVATACLVLSSRSRRHGCTKLRLTSNRLAG